MGLGGCRPSWAMPAAFGLGRQAMNNGLLIGALVVVAVFLALPVVAALMGNGGEPEPDYVEEMGLSQLSRDRFESTMRPSYEETVQALGVEGVKVTDPGDLPPEEFGSAWDWGLWTRGVEAPDEQVYLWVNEYGDIMGLVFDDERRLVSFAGPDPESND